MKKNVLISLVIVFFSAFAFAQDNPFNPDELNIITGVYGNRKEECQVKLSLEDFHRTGRNVLVLEFSKHNAIAGGVGIVTQELPRVSQALKTDYGIVVLNNFTGLLNTRDNQALLRFSDEGMLLNVILEITLPTPRQIREPIKGISCYNLELIKEN